MNPQRLLEAYNEKFAQSLVGKWITAEGSFFMLYESWEFLEDGNAVYRYESGSGRQIDYYEWRQNKPFIIELNHKASEFDSETEPDDDALDDDVYIEKWIQINYEFRIAHSDISTDIVLCANKENVFFGCHTKISFDKASGDFEDENNSESSMVYQPSISIVNGYLKNIDKQSKKAKKLHLNNKFSIAFNSYNPEAGEMFFDVKMYYLLFKKLVAFFAFDGIEILYGSKKFYFKDFDALIKQIEKWNQIENGPIDALYLLQKNNVILYIETEYHTATGGPAPYSDSYNFAIYSKKAFINMAEIITMHCKDNSIRIFHNLNGLKSPKRTFFYTIKRFLMN